MSFAGPPDPDDVPLHGNVPNSSGTARGDVGGLALFGGVLMRSRTGFAIAMRQGDGSIGVSQVPWRAIFPKARGRMGVNIPMVRGIAAMIETMTMGTRALRHSTDASVPLSAGADTAESTRRTSTLVTLSMVLLGLFIVVLPNLAADLLGNWTPLGRILVGEGLPRFSEADQPLLFNAVAGIVRLVLLTCYVVALGTDGEVRSVFRYHGAEHMAVSAFEEGRDVTVARARRHSTLHPRCGTTFAAFLVIAAIPAFAGVDAVLGLHVSGYPEWPWLLRKTTQALAHTITLVPLVGIVFELLKFCGRNAGNPACRVLLQPGYWLQHLTTRRPDDRETEVAIVALFAALDLPAGQGEIRSYVVRGLEDDPSAPGYVPRSPARPKGE